MASKEPPSDVIFEILTRTGLRSLDVCKCVSKECMQLVEAPDFMPTYCRRTNNVSGFLIQGPFRHGFTHASSLVSIDHTTKPLVKFLPRHMQILSSCNQGLLCCRSIYQTKDQYYVCKPTTEQYQELPSPKDLDDGIKIPMAMAVLKSNPLRFKIVRLSRKGITGYGYEHCSEVFDSALWKWKETQTLVLEDDESLTTVEKPILVDASFHWLTTKNNVVAFHEPTESFYKFPLPKPMIAAQNISMLNMPKKLVNYQGKVGVGWLTRDSKMELWLKEGNPNTNRDDWRKHLVVDVGNLGKTSEHPSFVGFYNSGILLFKDYNRTTFYRVGNHSFSTIKLGNDFGNPIDIFQFRSDFEDVCFRA